MEFERGFEMAHRRRQGQRPRAAAGGADGSWVIAQSSTTRIREFALTVEAAFTLLKV